MGNTLRKSKFWGNIKTQIYFLMNLQTFCYMKLIHLMYKDNMLILALNDNQVFGDGWAHALVSPI